MNRTDVEKKPGVGRRHEGRSDRGRRKAIRCRSRSCVPMSPGMPLEWVDYREAARLYHTDQVAYTCGTLLYRLYGGTCARTGLAHRRRRQLHHRDARAYRQSGQSAGRGLYAAAQQPDAVSRATRTCACTAARVSHTACCRATMSRRSAAAARIRGATSCRPAAAATTPRPRARRSRRACSSLAVPFTPTYAEYIFLKGRRVLADQMEYLVAHFPRSSPLHERMQRWPM